ncbi:MAG TPA: hypothetical protein VFV38_50630 [Ktedonobacteraceae bacterium]|nr:hypothetical protein [Ktedonobacteraceae bacterium]
MMEEPAYQASDARLHSPTRASYIAEEGLKPTHETVASFSIGQPAGARFPGAVAHLAYGFAQRCHFLGGASASFRHRQFDLVIVFHMTPSCLVEIGVIVASVPRFVEVSGPFCPQGSE